MLKIGSPRIMSDGQKIEITLSAHVSICSIETMLHVEVYCVRF